jgi:hypothetical protein
MSFFEEVVKAGGIDKMDWYVTGYNFEPSGKRYWVSIYVQGGDILNSTSEVLLIEIDDLGEIPELLASPVAGAKRAKRLREFICPEGCLGIYEEGVI